jgi:hypothetical protein
MVHGVFALMNICLIAVLSTLRLPQHWSCRQMVHGVFALMNICLIVDLFAMRLLQCNHVSRWFMEFALMNICQIVFLSLRLLQQSCQQMVHGVFAFSTSDTSLFSRSALATAHRSCQQMVHGVFALMNICQIVALLLCACHSVSHVSRWFMECLHS